MRGERGSVSIVIAAGVGMALVIAIGVADVGRALVARSRAEAVADLAALAAAQDLAVPSDGDPALAADRYASANGARLVSCSCSVGSTEATVSVAVHVGGFLLPIADRDVVASARAVVDLPGGRATRGPASAGPAPPAPGSRDRTGGRGTRSRPRACATGGRTTAGCRSG